MDPTHIVKKIRKGDIIANISPVQIFSALTSGEQMFDFRANENISVTISSIVSEELVWKPGDRKKFGQHDIKLNDNTPISQKPYRTPFAKEKVINESIQKMLEMKVVEHSDSDWSSPIVLVKKSNGSERFCVNYRKLNDVIIKDRFPTPSIESKLNKLYGCTFFTSLDCTSGYWQTSE